MPSGPLTASEIEQLKAEAAKAKEYFDKLLRTAADFDNFRKRVARERADAAKYAHEPLMTKLIPVLDNLEIALAAVDDSPDKNVQALHTGISMIQQQLKSALAEAGMEEIDALHQKFDPHLHEAVSHRESTAVPDGYVSQQLRKGYRLRDRLLRPATVIVAKPPAAEDAEPSSDEAQQAAE